MAWKAEHRSQAVDKDGDWATEGDKHKHGGVMELLSVGYSVPHWEVKWVGDKFAQNGWDEVEWFGDDDQAAVIYKVTLRAKNTITGESFQTRYDLDVCHLHPGSPNSVSPQGVIAALRRVSLTLSTPHSPPDS